MSNILVILGPTASGKTGLAVQLAHKLNGEVVSVDSRQVYRGLDVGTGKDLNEYQIEGKAIPVHLIDIIDIGEKFSVAHFQFKALSAIDEILQKGKLPILCGGTGLYLQSILKKYQFSHLPDFLNKPLDYDLDFHVFGLNPPLEKRRENCRIRLLDRITNQGLIKEAENLLNNGVSNEELEWLGLEYKWLSLYLKGEISKQRFIEGLTIAIQQYAKRQMTFFRKMEKDGILIHWIPEDLNSSEKLDFISNSFNVE